MARGQCSSRVTAANLPCRGYAGPDPAGTHSRFIHLAPCVTQRPRFVTQSRTVIICLAYITPRNPQNNIGRNESFTGEGIRSPPGPPKLQFKTPFARSAAPPPELRPAAGTHVARTCSPGTLGNPRKHSRHTRGMQMNALLEAPGGRQQHPRKTWQAGATSRCTGIPGCKRPPRDPEERPDFPNFQNGHAPDRIRPLTRNATPPFTAVGVRNGRAADAGGASRETLHWLYTRPA
jgi:hypothetical protein